MSISTPTTIASAHHERPVRLRSATVDWVVNEDRQGTLFGQSAPNWFELDRDPRATVVKSGHHRRTWRVPLNDGVIFAKVFETQRGTAFSRLAYAMGLGTAHREWRASRAAECRGVPAVRCLGLGVDRRRRGRAVLLSEGLPNAVPLGQAWERGASSRATALSLVEAVARLFASAHNRGFVHRDPHPGNILVQSTADRRWEALFVDVHGAYLFNHSPSRRFVVQSLARLDHYFQRRATRSLRWRFLQSYVSLRRSFYVGSHEREPTDNVPGLAPGAPLGERRAFFRGLLSSIARARATHAAALARQRDRRIRRDGKYFATIALGNGWNGTFVLQLERRHAFPESDVPDRSKRDWRVILQPIINGVEAASIGGGLRTECSRPAGTWTRLRWSFTGSPQRKEFTQSHRLRHRDLRTELILGCLEHRGSGALIDQAILVRPVTSPHLSNVEQPTDGSN